MAKLWKKTAGPQNEAGLEELTAATLSITKPVIVYLSGILTTDDNPKGIRTGIEDIERLLKNRPQLGAQPEVLAVSHKNLRNIFNIFAYDAFPHSRHSKAAQEMAELLLMPLVAAEGKPLPMAEAARNLRNLTLVGYSAGSVFAQELFNATLKLMKKSGYAEKPARQLLSEVVLISMATVSRPTKECDRFTTLYLAGSDDIAVRIKNRLTRPLGKIFARYNDALAIRKISKSALLATATIAKKMWEWRDGPDGSSVKFDISPLFPKNWWFRSHHEIEHYVTSDQTHNPMAKLVVNALINAVNRRGSLAPEQLLEPVTAAGPVEAQDYRQRIRDAFTAKSKLRRRDRAPKAPQNVLSFSFAGG